MDGAEAWARKNLTNGKANICKIVVADDSVRALAVGSDSFYENKKYILVAPDFTIKTVNAPTNATAGNGSPVLLFEIRGPGKVGPTSEQPIRMFCWALGNLCGPQ